MATFFKLTVARLKRDMSIFSVIMREYKEGLYIPFLVKTQLWQSLHIGTPQI